MILQKALNRLQITELNKMQLAVAEVAKKGADMLLLSPTGSGKTLAFLLPILQQLKHDFKGVQVLVLVPSRELALQIEQVFKQMTNEFKVTCCYGGHATKTELNNLIEAPAVLIGTPGRLAFHIDNRSFDVQTVSHLVLDEFDKCLEFGFQTDMSYIIKSLKSLKQSTLTSATNLKELPDFINKDKIKRLNFLSNSDIKPDFKTKTVLVTDLDRFDRLFLLLSKYAGQSAIVFVNFREASEEVADYLSVKGVECQVYHGGLEQEDREKALMKFRNRSASVLITTDLGARGLDIPEVENIIHFQMPNTEDAFIHRNGRTARMNAKGNVFAFVKISDRFPYLEAGLAQEDLGGKYAKFKQTNWQTLYLSVGKRDKVNKVDIVGFLLKTGELQKEAVGLIEVKDKGSYVAIKRDVMAILLEKLQQQKIKGKKVKVEVAL